jgi:hypothetical protein
MVQKKRFDLETKKGRENLEAAYVLYMRPRWNIVSVAAYIGTSPTTLGAAFKEAGLPRKVNHAVNPLAILKEQAALECPLDYLTAKYDITAQAIYKWADERKWKLVRTRRALGQQWWDTFFARFDTPNEAVLALMQKPHSIPAHNLPALYHKRVRPTNAVLWQMTSPTPYNELDITTFIDYSNMSERDEALVAHRWLGIEGTANPIKWTETPMALVDSTAPPTDEELIDDDEDESDLDIHELAAEMGIE